MASKGGRSLLALYRQLARTQNRLAVIEGSARWYREEIVRLKGEIKLAELQEKQRKAEDKSTLDMDSVSPLAEGW